MAISASGGVAGNTTSSVSSFALPSCNPSTGQDLIIAVSLSSTSSSVSSITNGGPGTYGTPTLRASVNGTGIRIELWSIHVTTGGSSVVFTINITGGACQVAACLEEYAGITGYGNTGTNTGSAAYGINSAATTTQGNNWVVNGMGFACQSGDTWNEIVGTNRQATLPSATAVSNAISDSTEPADGTFGSWISISTSRQWASVSLELQAGGAAIAPTDYGDQSTAWNSTTTYVVGQTALKSGVVYRCILGNTNQAPPNATYWAQQDVPNMQQPRDVRYQDVLEPLFCEQQLYATTAPPSAPNNYGFVG